MKIEILYTKKSKKIKPVADFDDCNCIDLLIIGFDDSIWKDSQLENFIKHLNRHKVRNLALFNAFYINDHKMQNMIKLCQETDLPLMREQYSFKLTFKQLKEIDQNVIDGARLYVEDMVNLVRDYY